MSGNPSDSASDATPPQSTSINDALDSFEAAWQSGRRPRIEDYLDAIAVPQRTPLLTELMVAEIHWRRHKGEQPQAGEYLNRFPGFEEQINKAFEGPPSDDTQVAAPEGTSTRPRGLQIRCPHCRNSVELLNIDLTSEIKCPSCNSKFSLAGDISPGGKTDADAAVAPPKQVSHFRLDEQLGEGAFGSVWRARDTQLDRVVAVKIPRKGQLNFDEAEQFLREARAAAQLTHPGIVSVHEIGREDATIYIVSDYIDGLPLDRWLTDQRPTHRETAEICAKIAEALHYAHEQKVIHRDLKPSNIMVDVSGQPHIMDFGLAKREAGEVTMTLEGQVLGTPAYMSPEQARGEGHAVDRRCDVYSLGVILFELLTGERPFRGSLRMLLKQVVEDEPPALHRLDGTVPRDLETICLKCLEKAPDRRYPTAEAVVEELSRYLGGEPIHSRPMSRSERMWRWCRRRPLLTGMASAVVLSLLSGTVVSTYFAIQADGRAIEAERARGRANANADTAVRRMGEAVRARYILQITLAQHDLENNEIAHAKSILDECREDLKGWEHSYLAACCDRRMRVLAAHNGHILCAAYSPDSRRIVTGGVDGKMHLWDVETGQGLSTLDGCSDGVTCAAFSPDGRRLATGGADGALVIWDATTGSSERIIKAYEGPVADLAFSPNGKSMVSGCGSRLRLGNQHTADGTVKVWDTASGKMLHAFIGHSEKVLSVAYSPNGDRVASGSADKTVRIWNQYEGKEVLALDAHEFSVIEVAFSPDGNQLITGCSGGTRKVWDTQSGELLFEREAYQARRGGDRRGADRYTLSPDGTQVVSANWDGTLTLWDRKVNAEPLTLKRHSIPTLALTFSPDGDHIASGGDDGTLRIWQLDEVTPFRLEGHDEWVPALAYHPVGTLIATGSLDHTVRLWDAATGEETSVLRGHTDSVTDVAFSPDETRIASSSMDGAVKIWDVASSEAVLAFTRHTERVNSIAFSPDGRWVASGSSDKTVKVWNASSGAERLTLTGHTAAVFTVVFSRDGCQIASGGFDKSVRIWDAATGKELANLDGHKFYVECLAFSPDGKRLVSASWDNTLRTWDLATGDAILTFKGHTDAVHGVAYSPDGTRIVSGAWDKTVRMWNAETGEEVLTLRPQVGYISDVAFSPDGNRILSANEDGTVTIWTSSVSDRFIDSSPADLPELIPCPGSEFLCSQLVIASEPPGMKIDWSAYYTVKSPDEVVKHYMAKLGSQQHAIDGENGEGHEWRYETEGPTYALEVWPATSTGPWNQEKKPPPEARTIIMIVKVRYE